MADMVEESKQRLKEVIDHNCPPEAPTYFGPDDAGVIDLPLGENSVFRNTASD